MFGQARRRLAFRYVVLFGLVLAVFSAVFFVAISIVIQPAFDIGPEPPTGLAAERAYVRTIERIGVAILVADVATIAIVGGVAWYLADRTLRPIRDAHERQGRFVADASHEIRSPLAIIRTTVDHALEPTTDDAARRDDLVTIGAAVDRLSATSRGLLTLAAVERRPGGSDERVDVSVAVAEAVALAQGAASPGHPAIDVNLEPDLVVLGDDASLTSLVRNLVENALRHGAGAPVSVRTGGNATTATVEVRDRGPGIPPQDLPRIFEPFYRVRADSRATPGTGLGLAIAARLARELGGRLQAESTVGAGTTMLLTLPRAR